MGKTKTKSKKRNRDDVEIGAKLRKARKAKGFTLPVLGEKIGVSMQQVQKYESGINRISMSRAKKICAALDIRAAHFFDEQTDEEKAQIPGRIFTYARLLEEMEEGEGKELVLKLIKYFDKQSTPKLARGGTTP